MAWQVPNDTFVSAATAIYLGSTNDVFVSGNVTIANDAGVGIYGIFGFHEGRIFGTVVATENAYLMTGDFGIDNSNELLIGATGHVETLGDNWQAVHIVGYGTKVENRGYVSGDHGILLNGANFITQSTILNSGQIEAGVYAILRDDNSTETIALTNTGSIVGGSASYYGGATEALARDLITNNGLMVGDVLLGLGADVYDGRGGQVLGKVFGGDGADEIHGGAENNVLDGGAHADRVSGGGGSDVIYGKEANDRLTGGLGDDRFVFDTRLVSNVDVVTDFTNARGNDDRFVLSDLRFLGLSEGALASTAFKDVIGGGAVDADDRLIYSHSSGNLYFDRDGSDTTYAMVKFATLENKALLSAGDFLVA